jgi:NTP pyrophosphatase (non-canonical NTP hydrolase)
MTINELVQEAFEMAKAKGWHDQPRTPLEIHSLIHSEVSEATEAVRDGLPPFTATLTDGKVLTKPEGELVELADVIIRIADYCGSQGWDLSVAIETKMAYNGTRPYRHGKVL